MEFCLAESGKDLLDHRTGGDTTLGLEIDPFADDVDVSVAASVGPLVSGVGAVGISQRFPTTYHHCELFEPQNLGMTD